MAFIDIIKPWFLTAKKPTQGQFHLWMDYLRWKDEKITFADLHPDLQAIINALAKPVQVAFLDADGDVVIPADCEVWMITFKNDIGGDTLKYRKITLDPLEGYQDEDLEITAGVICRSRIGFGMLAGMSIRFEGITSMTTIKIYKA